MRLIQNAQTASDVPGSLHHHGGRRRHALPDGYQYRDGHRPDAGHGNSSAADELRRLLGSVHLPRARHRDEHPDAPLRELKRCEQWLCSDESRVAPRPHARFDKRSSPILVHTGFTRLSHPGRRNPAPHWRKAPGTAALRVLKIRKKAGQAEIKSVGRTGLKGMIASGRQTAPPQVRSEVVLVTNSACTSSLEASHSVSDRYCYQPVRTHSRCALDAACVEFNSACTYRPTQLPDPVSCPHPR